MLNKREQFFKHIINDHIFTDGVDLDGWYWYGETKYKAFGGEEDVLVEISDAYNDQYAYSYKSYEDLFRCGWLDSFQDWLENYDFTDSFDSWRLTIHDVLKLKEYGCLSKRFIEYLVEDLTKEETKNEL